MARILLFGPGDPRGRPLEGTLESVGSLTSAEVARLLPELLEPARASFVFAGDLEPDSLAEQLEQRFGAWRSSGAPVEFPAAPALVEPPPGRIAFVDRPDAPQTVIQILRPLPPAEGLERAARTAVDTVFGGTFTSRLNANLREDKGYSYGARSRIQQEGEQFLMSAWAAVVTQYTGASLEEFEQEFARMAASGITAEELRKATASERERLVEVGETTASQARWLAELVRDGRALDALSSDLVALDSLDLESANRVARSGAFGWEDLQVVLVGDRDAILTQLAEAGFPPPLEVDASGTAKL